MEDTFVANLRDIWNEIGYPAEDQNAQLKSIAIKLANFYNEVQASQLD